MSPTIQSLGIDQLSNEEKIRLIGEIWDSIAQSKELVIPEHHREELERRIAAAKANPGVGQSWEEVEAEILGKRCTTN